MLNACCFVRRHKRVGWGSLAAKFNRLAAPHADSGVRTGIVDAVRRLDELDHPGVDELAQMLANSTDFR